METSKRKTYEDAVFGIIEKSVLPAFDKAASFKKCEAIYDTMVASGYEDQMQVIVEVIVMNVITNPDKTEDEIIADLSEVANKIKESLD